VEKRGRGGNERKSGVGKDKGSKKSEEKEKYGGERGKRRRKQT
jgi:hypothetical protein